MENVDKTIDAICNWIQKELEKTTCTVKSDLPEMTKALAELISARKSVH